MAPVRSRHERRFVLPVSAERYWAIRSSEEFQDWLAEEQSRRHSPSASLAAAGVSSCSLSGLSARWRVTARRESSVSRQPRHAPAAEHR